MPKVGLCSSHINGKNIYIQNKSGHRLGNKFSSNLEGTKRTIESPNQNSVAKALNFVICLVLSLF